VKWRSFEPRFENSVSEFQVLSRVNESKCRVTVNAIEVLSW